MGVAMMAVAMVGVIAVLMAFVRAVFVVMIVIMALAWRAGDTVTCFVVVGMLSHRFYLTHRRNTAQLHPLPLRSRFNWPPRTPETNRAQTSRSWPHPGRLAA